MKRIFLHAGQPKTGTTAIQHFLGKNRKALLACGYFFPREGLSHISNHGPLILDILGAPNSARHRGSAQRVAQAIRESPAPNAVISAERLYPYFRTCLAGGLRNAVVEYFLQTGVRTSILIYLRDDLARLNSAYIQHVKSFRSDASLHDYVRDEIKLEACHSRLPGLAVPPRVDVIFRPFNISVQKGGAVRDFLLTIGLSEDEIATFEGESRVNDSLGPIALEAARQTLAQLKANEREPSLRQRTELRNALFDLVRQESPETSFYGMDARLREFVDRTVRDDRDAFSRTIWGRDWIGVFEPEERPVNIFVPSRAEAGALQHYRRLLDGLRAAAATIMADEAEAKPPAPRSREREDPKTAYAMSGFGAGERDRE
jgi:hypothetical protein